MPPSRGTGTSKRVWAVEWPRASRSSRPVSMSQSCATIDTGNGNPANFASHVESCRGMDSVGSWVSSVEVLPTNAARMMGVI